MGHQRIPGSGVGLPCCVSARLPIWSACDTCHPGPCPCAPSGGRAQLCTALGEPRPGGGRGVPRVQGRPQLHEHLSRGRACSPNTQAEGAQKLELVVQPRPERGVEGGKRGPVVTVLEAPRAGPPLLRSHCRPRGRGQRRATCRPCSRRTGSSETRLERTRGLARTRWLRATLPTLSALRCPRARPFSPACPSSGTAA